MSIDDRSLFNVLLEEKHKVPLVGTVAGAL